MKAGSVEFGIDGRYDVDSDDDTTAYAELTLGYFLVDGFETGLKILEGTTATGRRDTMGIFFEYDYLTNFMLVPGAGMAFHHIASPRNADEEAARAFSLYLQGSLMVADNAALAMRFQADYASGSVLGDAPEDRKRRNMELNLGLRLFL